MQRTRYSTVAILLHWIIAIAVIVNWRIAASAEHLPREEAGPIMANHKALGMTILVLTVLRIMWRLIHKTPPLSDTLAQWEKILARTVHALFYILLISMPLLGWIASSKYGAGIDMWGLFNWPALGLAKNPDVGHQIFEVHATLGTVFLILIALHIAGALKHHFIDKNGELWRMLPGGTPQP